MTKLAGILLLVFLMNSIAFAELPLFENQSVQSVHFIKEMYSKMTKDGEVFTFESPSNGSERGGEVTKWISMHMDAKNGRIAVRWLEQTEQPENYRNPDRVRLYDGNTFYDISYAQKRVYIEKINFRQLTSNFALSGWFYDGINLAKTIESLPDQQKKNLEDGTFSFWLRQPQTQYPAEIYVNEEIKRVSKVHTVQDDSRFRDEKIETVESIEWAKAEDTDFWYPNVIQSNVDGTRGIKTETKTWVRHIELNADIPQKVFKVNYPEEFQVIDSRKLIKPLQF